MSWWAWLIIGVVALVLLSYITVGVAAYRVSRRAMREIDLNLGPSRRASSRHFTDPF